MNAPGKSTQEDIVDLTATDLPQVVQILRKNALPYEDCYTHIDNFVGIFSGQDLVAIGGIENLGNTGLVRSVAVQANYRGQGLGFRIVKHVHWKATLLGIDTLYLLTETAEGFFRSLGYDKVDRKKLPTEITQTKQFQILCPESAGAMIFHLLVDNS